MKIMRNVALFGIAKRIFDEARKPENQRRIKSAVDSARAKRSGTSRNH